MKTATGYSLIIALAMLFAFAPAEAGKRKMRAAVYGQTQFAPARKNGRVLQWRVSQKKKKKKKKKRAGQTGSGKVISPSVALRRALRYSPGSKGLGVRLMPGPRPVYAVKLKSGNRVHRILIDARTGRRVGG